VPIKIPDTLPARDVLDSENIFVMTDSRAAAQDIRPLRLIILNLMPNKTVTETQLLRCLSNTPLQIEVELLQTSSYTPKNTGAEHLLAHYTTFEKIRDNRYDGMIITGAPVEHLPFEEVAYWSELCKIMEWSKTHVTSTFHICWGAQAALYHHYGVPKYDLPGKMSGIFPHTKSRGDVKLFRGFDDAFWAPHSRHTETRREDILRVPALEILSESEEAGVYIAASKDGRYIFVTGHSEYDPLTLQEEYERDLAKGLRIAPPAHYSPGQVNWRAHAGHLYSNWLNYYVYQETPYKILMGVTMLNKQEAGTILTENILPFWQKLEDKRHGGFYGETDFYGKPDINAHKGGIMNSRILWTFSAAYRAVKDESYKKTAEAAYHFMQKHLTDNEYGGLYWLTHADGKPLEKKKHFYNIAFGIYALSEYYMATKDDSAMRSAISLFDKMEEHGRDGNAGGYMEACGPKWEPIEDFRLSDKDINGPKSMNTNLHVMEAYTNLLRASGNGRVRDALYDLVRVTLAQIIADKKTFLLFFEMDWKPLDAGISYGHDIEGSWLLYDAALALGDGALIKESKEVALTIAEAVYGAAVDHANGGLLSGLNAAGALLAKKEWWPQAEAVVGFYNAYKLSGEEKYKKVADDIWQYIINHFIDNENGDWHNELFPNNRPDAAMPKSGFWKCPYHNGRMCLEIMKRLG
jgi:homoserine O-succinyltransferase